MSTWGRAIQLGLLAVAGILVIAGLSVYAARDNLIRYTLNPGRAFGSGAQPVAPDYALSNTWAVRTDAGTQAVDVFFIYPTVYFSGEYWNAPVGNTAVRERLSRIIHPLYADPFAASANLYMPYYRQAAPYSFMGGTEYGRQARELAYKDVSAAFKFFLKHYNRDRPFIIAGYGQGALYGFKLVADLEPQARARLVAAYLLEVAIPLDVTAEMAKGTPLCDSPDQTGCMVIWHSTTQNARSDIPRENALVWNPGGGFDATRGRELACVNPLTWTITGRAGNVDMNLGSAMLSEFGPGKVTLNRAATAADCWNGLLFTDITPDPLFLWSGPRYRDLFPSNINPFYADIKDNVARRAVAFAAQKAGPPPATAESATPASPDLPIEMTSPLDTVPPVDPQ
jgi:hypothetical protein